MPPESIGLPSRTVTHYNGIISPHNMKKYSKKTEFSYTIGAFTTFELLENAPGQVIRILYSSRLDQKLKQKLVKITNKHVISLVEDDFAIEKATPKGNVFMIGVFKKLTRKVNPNSNHIVLVNPSNRGNLGTILRTAAGFGFKDVVILRDSVDIFHPDVISSSRGAIFRIQCEYFDSFEEYQNKHSKGRMLVPFLTTGKSELSEIEFSFPYSLIFGNEAKGLPKSFSSIGTPARISQTDQVDSLNLAVAAGVAMYSASKLLE